MAILHNRVSNEELKKRLYAETDFRTTISFYKYFHIDDPKEFRDYLYSSFNGLKVFGRIYVAHEGINAQISVPDSNFEALRSFLYSIPALNNLRFNYAVDNDGKSFWVLKVKVRDKIVADGITDPDFSMEKNGKYVTAVEMNELLEDENTIVLDMRNHYEYEVGHFEKAIEVPSDTFREQLPKAVDMMQGNEDKNIIMYCTGGIRCEKASAYMLHNGFKNVFHLEGGVINYAREVTGKRLKSKYAGKIFVFDNRLGEKVTPDIISNCHQCGNPADSHTNCANPGCHILFIQCDNCGDIYKGCCSPSCKEVIELPEEEQKILRKSIKKTKESFNKSRKKTAANN